MNYVNKSLFGLVLLLSVAVKPVKAMEEIGANSESSSISAAAQEVPGTQGAPAAPTEQTGEETQPAAAQPQQGGIWNSLSSSVTSCIADTASKLGFNGDMAVQAYNSVPNTAKVVVGAVVVGGMVYRKSETVQNAVHSAFNTVTGSWLVTNKAEDASASSAAAPVQDDSVAPAVEEQSVLKFANRDEVKNAVLALPSWKTIYTTFMSNDNPYSNHITTKLSATNNTGINISVGTMLSNVASGNYGYFKQCYNEFTALFIGDDEFQATIKELRDTIELYEKAIVKA